MFIRIFGSDDCERCKIYLPALENAQIDFVFIDADADEHEELCDEHEIDELPVTQIVGDDENVLGELIGPLQPDFLKQWIEEIFAELKK